MNVEGPVRRKIEHLRRKNQAIGCGHDRFRARRREPRCSGRFFKRSGLKNFEPARFGQLLYCACCRPQSAPGRSIGLSDDQRYAMLRIKQSRKNRGSESRRTSEHDPHWKPWARMRRRLIRRFYATAC
jgi:hypothetical protein